MTNLRLRLQGLRHPHRVAPPVVPVWLLTAMGELGASEIAGRASNARIEEYLAAAGLVGYTDDTAWCAGFGCWCLEESGIVSPRSAVARNFLRWGVGLDEPRLGAIVVIERGHGWKSHVGFCMGTPAFQIMLLGGNQANRVCVKTYPNKVLGYRWPEGYPL